MTLDQLGIKHGTDKASTHHNYLGIYESYLAKWRHENITIVDAVGGYEYRDRGGQSLRMWAEYFQEGKVVGIDLYEKELPMPDNVHLYKCDQASAGMTKIFETEGAPHVFIDDFSHVNHLTIETFKICFPLLQPGGVYIVEDIEGSWYPDHGYGGTNDYNDMNFPSIVNYFRKLTNGLNAKFIANYPTDDICALVHTIHFYTNCIILIKK